MNRIAILEPSATVQNLIKEKVNSETFELTFESKGLSLLVSVYNNLPSAILINANCINPDAINLVRLIKNIVRLKNIPLALYATGDFVFDDILRENSGADKFYKFDKTNIEECLEDLLLLCGKELAEAPMNDVLKSGLAKEIFMLVSKLNSFEELIQNFLNLVGKSCEVPAAAIYLDTQDGISSYYVSADNITEAEEKDFIKVCSADFETAFPYLNVSNVEPQKLQNTDVSENYHTNDIPLSAYQEVILYNHNEIKIGSVYAIKEGSFSLAQLDLLHFAAETFGAFMETAIMLKGKLKFEKNIRKAFSRFVPEQIIDELVEGAEREEKVGVGEKRDVAILFSDIRSFTNISERNQPETIVAFLNRYFTIMCTIIKKHGGTIDKFIGDAIMALFGAPVSYEDNARRAVAAAYEMREALASVPLEDLVLPDGMKFDIGIGIHYGDVIVGSIGSSDKTDYSVIGDNVNLASRLEGLTKTYGSKILVSQAVKDDIKTDEFVYRLLDDVKVKGKKKAVPIYSIDRSLDEFSEVYRDSYSKGFGLYKQGVFNLALEYFSKALAECPEDKATKLMISRCEDFIKNPPQDWDGAIAFTTK